MDESKFRTIGGSTFERGDALIAQRKKGWGLAILSALALHVGVGALIGEWWSSPVEERIASAGPKVMVYLARMQGEAGGVSQGEAAADARPSKARSASVFESASEARIEAESATWSSAAIDTAAASADMPEAVPSPKDRLDSTSSEQTLTTSLSKPSSPATAQVEIASTPVSAPIPFESDEVASSSLASPKESMPKESVRHALGTESDGVSKSDPVIEREDPKIPMSHSESVESAAEARVEAEPAIDSPATVDTAVDATFADAGVPKTVPLPKDRSDSTSAERTLTTSLSKPSSPTTAQVEIASTPVSAPIPFESDEVASSSLASQKESMPKESVLLALGTESDGVSKSDPVIERDDPKIPMSRSESVESVAEMKFEAEPAIDPPATVDTAVDAAFADAGVPKTAPLPKDRLDWTPPERALTSSLSKPSSPATAQVEIASTPVPAPTPLESEEVASSSLASPKESMPKESVPLALGTESDGVSKSDPVIERDDPKIPMYRSESVESAAEMKFEAEPAIDPPATVDTAVDAAFADAAGVSKTFPLPKDRSDSTSAERTLTPSMPKTTLTTVQAEIASTLAPTSIPSESDRFAFKAHDAVVSKGEAVAEAESPKPLLEPSLKPADESKFEAEPVIETPPAVPDAGVLPEVASPSMNRPDSPSMERTLTSSLSKPPPPTAARDEIAAPEVSPPIEIEEIASSLPALPNEAIPKEPVHFAFETDEGEVPKSDEVIEPGVSKAETPRSEPVFEEGLVIEPFADSSSARSDASEIDPSPKVPSAPAQRVALASSSPNPLPSAAVPSEIVSLATSISSPVEREEDVSSSSSKSPLSDSAPVESVVSARGPKAPNSSLALAAPTSSGNSSTTMATTDIEAGESGPEEGDPEGESQEDGGSEVAAASKSERFAYLEGIRSRLARYKKYPRQARRRHLEGSALLAFVVDREGRVIEHRIERSAGHRLLDSEARRLIERAAPFPPIPAKLNLPRMLIRVPVEFYLN